MLLLRNDENIIYLLDFKSLDLRGYSKDLIPAIFLAIALLLKIRSQCS